MENPEADFEELEPLLRPGPPAREPGQLRQDLLRQTTGVLRGRARARRLAAAAALVACYAAGLATMHFAGPWLQRPADPPPRVAPGPPGPAEDRPGAFPPNVVAARLEQQGETAAGRERARIFQLAGTRYLEESCDIRSALRCYANALDDDTEMTPNPQDHWLLMALRDARQKEKADAKNSD
jgi:hypothetical protein